MNSAVIGTFGALLLGIAGLVSAVWRIAADRSHVRVLERLNLIIAGLPGDSEARDDLLATQAALARGLKSRYSERTAALNYLSAMFLTIGVTGIAFQIVAAIIPTTNSFKALRRVFFGYLEPTYAFVAVVLIALGVASVVIAGILIFRSRRKVKRLQIEAA